MTCWDRQDRWGFYSLVLLVWLSAGISGFFGEAALQKWKWPIAGTSGTLRSPTTQEFLQGLPPSPDRDALRALSLQQAERYNEAEALYGTLPASAWTWNNRGVLQTALGKSEDAKQSFDRALRIDPELSEAAFNLGGTVSDPWVEMHAKFLPGQNALAVPPHDMIYRAVRGSYWRFAGRAILGPFSGWPVAQQIVRDIENRPLRLRAQIVFYEIVACLLGLCAAVFFAPKREVTQPPGKRHWLLELIVPGTAHAWGRAGGVLLAAAIWGIAEIVTAKQIWTPFNQSVNVKRAFGLPPSLSDVDSLWPVNLASVWQQEIVVMVVLVLAINAFVVIAARRRLRVIASDPPAR